MSASQEAKAEGMYLVYDTYHKTSTTVMKDILEKFKAASLVNFMDAHEEMVYKDQVMFFYGTKDAVDFNKLEIKAKV